MQNGGGTIDATICRKALAGMVASGERPRIANARFESMPVLVMTVTEAKVKTALGIGKAMSCRKGAAAPCRRHTSGDDRPRWLGENTRLPGLSR